MLQPVGMCAQYELFPYPRWQGLPAPSEGRQASRPLHVMIAGCGTGRHALIAARRYGVAADITAIDLSRTSLGYAEWQRQRYGIANVRFWRADLLALGKGDWDGCPPQGFDMIESIGVLHHLREPEAGLAILCDLLAPGGSLHLGLYRAGGRRHVQSAREEIKALGLSGDAVAIRAYRRRVIDDGAHPLHGDLGPIPDFYSVSGTKDLLFHVQERDYTLPDIAEMLDRHGLVFDGMDVPGGVIRLFLEAEGPDGDASERLLTDLAAWHRFAEARPDVFDTMWRIRCVRHA